MKTVGTYGIYDERWRAYAALKWYRRASKMKFWVEQLEDGRWAVKG